MSKMVSFMLISMAQSGERSQCNGDNVEDMHDDLWRLVELVWICFSDEIDSRKLSKQSMLEQGMTEMNVYRIKQWKRMRGFKGTNEGQDQLVSCAERKREGEKKRSRLYMSRLKSTGSQTHWETVSTQAQTGRVPAYEHQAKSRTRRKGQTMQVIGTAYGRSKRRETFRGANRDYAR